MKLILFYIFILIVEDTIQLKRKQEKEKECDDFY